MLQSFCDKDTERVWQRRRSKRLDQTTQRAALRKLLVLDAADRCGDRAEHCPVAVGERWPLDLSAKDLKLLAQDDDLEVLGASGTDRDVPAWWHRTSSAPTRAFPSPTAIDLRRTERRSAAAVLLRPAIECWIDCCYVLYCNRRDGLPRRSW